MELLGNLRDSDEGERDRHGLAGVRDTPTAGAGTGLQTRKGLRFNPPELGGRSGSTGWCGDHRPGHHRDRGHHGLPSHGGHQAGVQHWQAGPRLSGLSVLLIFTLQTNMLTL